MKIDSHQHFWQYDPKRDTWMEPHMHRIRKDFLPEQLAPLLKEHRFDGCIAVQADPSEKETDFLLNIAEKHPYIKGVVGWIDLCDAGVATRLEHYKHFRKLKGLRHIVQAEADDFLYRADFRAGIAQFIPLNLCYDLLIYPRQLQAAIDFAHSFPDLKIILDHGAKPAIKQGQMEPWKTQIQELAKAPNVSCKLSGLLTEASWDTWTPTQINPYLKVLYEAFGEDRLLYGSDWPVCLLAGSYAAQLNVVQQFLARKSAKVQEKIMGLNAEKIYSLAH